MTNKIELKKIIADFQRYSNNMLFTKYEECDANFKRFKKFIDDNELVHDIVYKKIKDSKIDFRKCFLIPNSYNEELSIPEDESDHLKAIYDFMDMIEKNTISIFNIASLYYCDSRRKIDIIHNFYDIIIFPLVDYIKIELGKKLLEYDDFYPNVSFSGNNSPVYFHSIGLQNVEYKINDEELFDLVLKKIELLRQEGVTKKDIDELKKACKNKDKNKVVSFLKDIATNTVGSLIATGILAKFGI